MIQTLSYRMCENLNHDITSHFSENKHDYSSKITNLKISSSVIVGEDLRTNAL